MKKITRETMEIDESKIGKSKFNRGYFVKDQWVFGGEERATGRFFWMLSTTEQQKLSSI